MKCDDCGRAIPDGQEMRVTVVWTRDDKDCMDLSCKCEECAIKALPYLEAAMDLEDEDVEEVEDEG